MYVLEGTIWARCGESRFEVGPRSFVFLPRGVPHEWDVVGAEAVILIITAPGGLEEFLHDFHDARGDRGEIARRYGIDFP
jgi:quercetin dioxygenase-like cupin family protein